MKAPVTALDLPAPDWIAESPAFMSAWAKCLISASRLGRITNYSRGEDIQASPGALFFIIRGCVVATSAASDEDASPVFLGVLKRGEMVTPVISNTIQVSLKARSPTILLTVPAARMGEFEADTGLSGKLLLALEVELARIYAAAAQATTLRDQGKILRVIEILAQHPESHPTAAGREIEASKDEIRTLAGVHKRSATRAFQNLEQAGVVMFNGYKRVYFMGGSA